MKIMPFYITIAQQHVDRKFSSTYGISKYFRNTILGALLLLISFGTQAQENPISFEKHVLTTSFYSEGVAIGDVNQDGQLDVISGAFWYEAPDWTPHEIMAPKEFDKSKTYSNSFLNFAMDVNQDGWIDLIRVDWPGQSVVWHENPQNQSGHWKEHLIHDHQGNESPRHVDVNGDGRKDIVCNDPERKQIIWLEAPSEKGDTQWKKHIISKKEGIPGTHQYTHGLGVADLNYDGRMDVIINKGWWEGPEDPTLEEWTFHPVDFGPDCAQMHVYDVDGDGDPDVISSSAHDYGIWWYEQKVQLDNSVQWIQHTIDKSFSQTHSLVFTDLNEDGHPDLITGKRHFAHNGHDPGGMDPAVVYWYEFVPGIFPQWIPHQIDDDSGVGLNHVVKDINGDGKKDIVTANKNGVFVFLQK